MVFDFKRSSGEDARALLASSGGKHRFEKYMAIPLGFLEYTEKTRNMVSEVVKDNDPRLLLTRISS